MFSFKWVIVLALVMLALFGSGAMAAGACSARTSASCGVAKANTGRVVKAAAKVRPFARIRSAFRGGCGG